MNAMKATQSMTATACNKRRRMKASIRERCLSAKERPARIGDALHASADAAPIFCKSRTPRKRQSPCGGSRRRKKRALRRVLFHPTVEDRLD
jgi:hypothetical protein